MSSVITFDVTTFRLQFPAFADPVKYPDALLQQNWDMATCYISNTDYGLSLTGNCLVLALNYMTAHLTALNNITAANQLPSLQTSATVDKVSVTTTPPPLKTQLQWWLSLTPYGQQLYALLQVKSAAGWYIGGLPETSAIRKVYGVF